MIDRKNILNLAIRHKIYIYIKKNAGLHLSKISKNLSIPRTTLIHHLRYLEDCDLIDKKREGKYLRYYSKESFGTFEKKLLSLLRQEIPCNIILIIYMYLAVSRVHISRILEIQPTTVDFHFKKLIDADIIEPAPVGKDGVYFYKKKILKRKPKTKEIIYRFKDVHQIDKILIAHKDSFKDVKLIKMIFGPLGFLSDEKLPEITQSD